MTDLKTLAETYQHRVQPYPHQQWVWERTRDLPSWGLFLEQRLGKSKVIVDTAAWLWYQDKIDGVLIVAPNGVHRAWVYGDASVGDDPRGHFGEHLPTDVPLTVAYWRSGMRKKEKAALARVLSPRTDKDRALRVLAINIEALKRDKQRRPNSALQTLETFLATHRVLWAVDESTCIKNLDGQRAAVTVDLAPRAAYRRLLSGEPAPEGPPDLWGQLMFLQDDPLGFHSFFTYQARYCKLENRVYAHPGKSGKRVERRSRVVVSIRNEDELARKLTTISTTLKRRDCGDMPEQVYSQRYVELSGPQAKAYQTLANEWYYELRNREQEFNEVEVERALTRMIRFRQLCGGFLPADEFNEEVHAFDPNPKLEALQAEIEDLGSTRKVIVWAVFRAELEMLYKRLVERYGDEAVVRYWGDVGADERDRAKGRFQRDPACRIFLGNPRVGRFNLTLAAADDVLWYSWGYPLEDYIQANDRPVLPGKKATINYTHLVVPGTFEALCLGSLRRKQAVADSIRLPVKLRELLKPMTTF